jgi:hypothetical protein
MSNYPNETWFWMFRSWPGGGLISEPWCFPLWRFASGSRPNCLLVFEVGRGVEGNLWPSSLFWWTDPRADVVFLSVKSRRYITVTTGLSCCR